MTNNPTGRWKLPDWLPPLTNPPIQLPDWMTEPWRPQQIAEPQTIRQRGQAIEANPGDRWFGLGTSGSGKTTWGKQLLKNLRPLWPSMNTYVIDSKGDPKDFGGWPGLIEQANPPKLLRRGAGDIQIWRPPVNNLAAYDEYMQSIREAREPAIVLVDELASVSNKSGEAVEGYQLLQKQGRGPGITTVTFSQELAGIDSRTIKQCTHLVRFGLMGETEQRRANVMMGRKPKDDEPKHRYGFWYQRLDRRPYNPVYYENWRAFF